MASTNDEAVAWFGRPRLRRGEGPAFNEALGELHHARDAKIVRYSGPAAFTLIVFGGIAAFSARLAGNWAIPLLWFIAISALTAVRLAARRRLNASALQIARRRTWQCIECWYDLQGIPVGKDGLTTCPECGAAWRLPPSAEAATHQPPSGSH